MVGGGSDFGNASGGVSTGGGVAVIGQFYRRSRNLKEQKQGTGGCTRLLNT